ncbi:MAG: alpha/beta hydrolase [Actinomycetia bacterium]|nr:alpha/beta hydrolase [Actinomycetes bacterium]
MPVATEGTIGEPEVVFAHANGFCKEVWRPVVSELCRCHADLRWMSIDLLGHGDNTDTDGPFTLDAIARDIGSKLEGYAPTVGVGHSSGGAGVARAETLRPATFSHLVLIEPIIYPPPYLMADVAIADAAQRRREVFPDRKAAYDRFLDSPLRDWRPDALAAYVDHGFEDSRDGWRIKCLPRVEAEIFRQGLNHDTWDRLDQISIPVTVVCGEHSDTHQEPHLTTFVERFSDAELVVVPDVGHFVPMERPDVIASIIGRILGDTSPR